MKPDLRWQSLLALVGLALVLMLLSYQVQSAALCTAVVPAAGGTFVEGMVGRPASLNPLLSDAYPIDRDLTGLIFDGLVAVEEDGRLVPSLAESWAYSEDGLTLTFTLRQGVMWHDGAPLTADDVAFTYGLMQAEAFPGPVELRQLWQSVTIAVIDDQTIQFTLTQPYAPFIEATTRGILPAHLLAEVDVADLAAADFNRAPVGSGPFMVQPGQAWADSGRLRLTPNPAYWRQGTQLSDLEFRFFATADDLLAAFRAGEVHAAHDLPPMLTPELLAAEGTRLFTSVAPRYTALFFNLSETGAPAVRTREVRQALAYGLDRQGLVDTVLDGQGLVFEGPFLPGTWAARPNLMTVYSLQPETSAALLDSAGWTFGDGGRFRDGGLLTLRLVALDQPEQRAVAEAIAGQWAALGIDTQVTLLPDGDALSMALAERAFDVALLDIAPPADPDLYDFWSQEAIVRGHNYTGWNNRRASEALEAARQLVPQGERAVYYEAFLRQFDADLPALTLYQHVTSYALSDQVQQAELGRLGQPRDRFATLPAWFLNFREIAVGCP
jgi:peptide/nickel transport system substrate-binding protein